MTKFFKSIAFLLWFCLVLAESGLAQTKPAAQLKLPQVFSSHMVLQREMPIPVWGWAKPGEKVTVKLPNTTVTATAGPDGKWKTALPAQKAGGPFAMEITSGAGEAVRFANVLIGDVFLCSGQSNMAFKMRDVANGSAEVKAASNPTIRLFSVKREMATTPQAELTKEKWEECTPENIAEFSAVAYFFARDLQKEINVPIGLIHTSWGGTKIENWMSAEALHPFPQYKTDLTALPKVDLNKLIDEGKASQKKWLFEVEAQDLGLKNNWFSDSFNSTAWKPVQMPEILERLEGLTNTDGIFWFKTTFKLSAKNLQDSLSLSLGLLDDEDITYINGKEVGRTGTKDYKRLYRVPASAFKVGENTVTVRLKNKGAVGGFRSNPDLVYVQSKAGKTSLAQTWKMAVGTPSLEKYPDNIVHPNQYPSSNFNAMVAPLIPYAIKGALWYQGESNSKEAYQYREFISSMVTDWRKKWGQSDDFWFLNVQLPIYKNTTTTPKASTWAELRESQAKVLELPKTGLAVLIDLGEADNIHPDNKQEVGRRLALVAQKNIYGKNIISQAPAFVKQQVEGNRIRLTLDDQHGPLVLKSNAQNITGFYIAGQDQKWQVAQAQLDKNGLVVFSPAVKEPVAVRYAWSDNPDPVMLFNQAGLPVAPFRTDTWPLSTQPESTAKASTTRK